MSKIDIRMSDVVSGRLYLMAQKSSNPSPSGEKGFGLIEIDAALGRLVV